jgi:hypothetical protein
MQDHPQYNMKVSDNSIARSTFSIEEDDELNEFEIDFDFPEPSSFYDAKRGVKIISFSLNVSVVLALT